MSRFKKPTRSPNDARSRVARSHAQPRKRGEHGEHEARQRRTLDGEARPYAYQWRSGASSSPAPLPRGEREEREGEHPRPGADGALDNLASNVSKPPRRTSWRTRRYTLRRTSARVVGGRQARCGVAPILSQVDIAERHGRNIFRGLETCGSVWTCPVCAVKVTEARREELKTLLDRHLGAGGRAAMFTFTVPHHAFSRLDELLHIVRNTWRKVKQGRAWKQACERFGWFGDVRALEVTHGENGWHPHLHVLVCFCPWADEADIDGLAVWMFTRWQRFVEKAGLGLCSRSAFSVERVTDGDSAGAYVQKWGAAEELTRAHTKKAKAGRTPWQILDDLATFGRECDYRLFKQYAEAFRCSRQLTWSRNFRKSYLPKVEITDEELAAEEITPETLLNECVVGITREVWAVIARRALQGPLLDAADSEGLLGVIQFLRAAGIAFEVVPGQGGKPLLVPFGESHRRRCHPLTPR